MRCLDVLFDDKRIAITFLMVWMVAVILLLQGVGLMHSTFMTFGPSPHTQFMTLHIDTWHKWFLLTSATFANTCVSDFFSDAIVPWIQNTIQDHKTTYLPYHKFVCYIISQLWTLYCAVMSIFAIGLMTSQIDFLIVRLSADLLTNTFTTYKFMRKKKVDNQKYQAWTEEVLINTSHVQDLQNSELDPLNKITETL
jgi:hypothetical protein